MIRVGWLLFLVATSIACGGRDSADASTLSRAGNTQSAPPTIELIDFEPALDPVATKLWERRATGDENARSELAAHYDQTGFRAMAKLVRATAQVRSSDFRQSLVPVSASRNPYWACPADYDNDALQRELLRMNTEMNDMRYVEAKRIGHAALERLGPLCQLSLETAVATLAADAIAQEDASSEEFERALRTAVTADIEMNIPPFSGAREWSYQLATFSFARRSDVEPAVVMAELALLRFEQRPAADRTDGGETMLRKLVERTRARLPK
jgi:hypothetical protein